MGKKKPKKLLKARLNLHKEVWNEGYLSEADPVTCPNLMNYCQPLVLPI